MTSAQTYYRNNNKKSLESSPNRMRILHESCSERPKREKIHLVYVRLSPMNVNLRYSRESQFHNWKFEILLISARCAMFYLLTPLSLLEYCKLSQYRFVWKVWKQTKYQRRQTSAQDKRFRLLRRLPCVFIVDFSIYRLAILDWLNVGDA